MRSQSISGGDDKSEKEETNIPDWHKDIVRQRLADFKKCPEQAIDFDEAMDDIERDL